MTAVEALHPDRPLFARTGVIAASAGLGAKGLDATHELFAPLQRMLEDSEAVFHPGRYDARVKWMDGWETWRRRGGGHDLATIRLAGPGRLLGSDVDTAHITGNDAPACGIEAAWVEAGGRRRAGTTGRRSCRCGRWDPPRSTSSPATAARSGRIRGSTSIPTAAGPGRAPTAPPCSTRQAETVDLASAPGGGRVLAFSDAHRGGFRRRLAPSRGHDMGDGWETRRRREPGHDWLLLALGARRTIEKAFVDTRHCQRNVPDRCSMQAADLAGFGDGLTDARATDAMLWPTLLPETELGPDAEHRLDMGDLSPVTPRLDIHPDGGVSRLRLGGRPRPAQPARTAPRTP